MRTLESSVCVDSLGELGIDAVSMSFGELFTALQTGAVDGQENPLFTIYNSRFYEVQEVSLFDRAFLSGMSADGQ